MTGDRLRRSARRPPIDDIDRSLIELLTENGRFSNRALASKVGLSEPTVGARLRSLAERRVLGVTASLDWVAAGYCWDAWLEIAVEERSPREVAVELARLASAHLVC